MKYIAAILALAATALAAPSERRAACSFGTYQCSADSTGIEICDVQGVWETVGPCPTGTACENLPQNGFSLPFCTNKYQAVAEEADGDYEKRGIRSNYCPVPGRYECDGYAAIRVCDTQNQYQKVGDCPTKSHCDLLYGIPYCLDNTN